MGLPRFISRSRKGLLTVCVGQPPRRIRRHSKPVFSLLTPPGPSVSSSPASCLPVELMSEIVSMACNEGRYEDMTTLQAVMQVSRRWYSVAAPRFWRSVNLHLKSNADLATLGSALSARTRSLVTTVKTRPNCDSSDVLPERLPLYASAISTCPNVCDLEIEILGGEGARGMVLVTDLVHSVFPQLTRLSVRAHKAMSIGPPLDWGNLRAILGALDPSRVTHLALHQLCGFDDRPTPLDLLSDLKRFVNLTYLHIDARSCRRWTIQHLGSVRGPLRSLHLELDDEKSNLQCASLGSFLSRFKVTLEYLYLSGEKCGEPAEEVFDLPKLRHLRLYTTGALDLLPCFASSPLEILDIAPGNYWHGLGGASIGNPVHLRKAVKAHSSTLEVVLMNDDLCSSTAMSSHMSKLIDWTAKFRVGPIWKGESPPERAWCDLDSLDDHQRSRKVDPSSDGIVCRELLHENPNVLLCDERGVPEEFESPDMRDFALHPALEALWDKAHDREPYLPQRMDGS